MTGLFENATLDLVRGVLEEAGFSADRVPPTRGSTELLLAENQYFVLVVAAAVTIDDFAVIEPQAVSVMDERVKDRYIGGKRWDLYLLLLTSQDAPDALPATDIFSINYNTRGLRRIAHSSIRTLGDVRRVLKPFLPVEEPPADGPLRSLLAEFADALTRRGVDSELVARSLTAFREGESLESV